jgi:protein-S-isoprenylcysteine O-methyltransferase Ste14
VWLVSIELGTSRSASRRPAAGDVEVDFTTGLIFDVSAALSLAGALAMSWRVDAATIRWRRSAVVVGVATLCGAGALSAWARRHLGRFHRDTLTRHADHELVTSGPYARIRHPLYTATIGVFVGIGVALGNWFSLAAAALPAAALRHRIGVEEHMLVDQFGDRYRDYSNRTGRLFPTVTRGRRPSGRGTTPTR